MTSLIRVKRWAFALLVSIKSLYLVFLRVFRRERAISGQYVREVPSAQAAVSIFQGEWLSRLPDLPDETIHSGTSELFDDSRIRWAMEQMGGVRGSAILELGPLEGAHSYMLDRAGAGSITAIEANTRAFNKCLIVKNLYQLNHTHLLCGDFPQFLASAGDQGLHFDLCVACGVLYHMTSPIEVIQRISRVTDSVYIWTHYFEKNAIFNNPRIAHRFSPGVSDEHLGFRYTKFKHKYKADLGFQWFAGGSKNYSNWITKDDLIGCLRHFGFNNISMQFDIPDSPAGPRISLLARK